LIVRPAAHKAQAALVFLQFAVTRTDVALDASIVKAVPVFGRVALVGADTFIHRGFSRQVSVYPAHA
jgi:hypothetical protein